MRLKVPYEIMQVEGQNFAVPMEESENGFGGMIGCAGWRLMRILTEKKRLGKRKEQA